MSLYLQEFGSPLFCGETEAAIFGKPQNDFSKNYYQNFFKYYKNF